MSVAPSLYNAVSKRPWLANMLKPLAGWYVSAAGYRQMGLRCVGPFLLAHHLPYPLPPTHQLLPNHELPPNHPPIDRPNNQN
jgi:hypothetical protein